MNILAYLRAQDAAGNFPPSRVEIAAATGIKSSSTVQRLLCNLRDYGYIKMQEGSARAIKVVNLDDGKK
jgi:SOS-response transcriptional repressor LexA